MFAMIAFMGPIGFQELIFILLILLIFFGAKRLPELAKGLGQGIKEFKKAAKEISEEDVSKIDKNEEKTGE